MKKLLLYLLMVPVLLLMWVTNSNAYPNTSIEKALSAFPLTISSPYVSFRLAIGDGPFMNTDDVVLCDVLFEGAKLGDQLSQVLTGTAFDDGVAKLTDGLNGFIKYEISIDGMGGEGGSSKESYLFFDDPTGTSGIDYEGFTINSISLDLEIISMNEDNSNPLGGHLSVSSFLTIDATPNPEPATIILTKDKIKIKDEPATDEFEVKGEFILGEDSDGIDLFNESVEASVNSFNIVIPANSFIEKKPGEYNFKGTIDGIEVDAKIKEIDTDTFEFKVKVKGFDLTGTTNVVNVKLLVGDDAGTADVRLTGDLKSDIKNRNDIY
jgi:hypothetical protein